MELYINMFKMPSFQGFYYEKTPYEELKEEIKNIEGYDIHPLKNSFDGREIYGFSLGDLAKPTIHIEGGIHGAHEWRTVHWVKRFMEILVNPRGLPQSNSINYLKAKYSFYFIPSVNPDGYEDYTYTNGNNVSIDRNFDYLWEETPEYQFPDREERWKGEHPFSEPEAQNIRDVVEKIKPVSLIDCHTWGQNNGFTIRQHPNKGSYNVLLSDYYESLNLTCLPGEFPDSKMSDVLSYPSAYNWAGEQLSSQGRKIIANVLETGAGTDGIGVPNSEQARWGLNGLILHCLYVDHHLTKNDLIKN